MNLQSHAEVPRARQDRLALGERERTLVAEDVAEASQSLGDDRGQHLVAHEPHITGAVMRELGGNGMGAEEGGNEPREQRIGGQSPHHAQRPDLALGVEAIAGLDLDGRHAPSREGRQPGPRQTRQLVLASAAEIPDAECDPAAAGGDFLVGGAREALLELVRSGRAEHGVSVGIDEAREGDPPPGVKPGGARRLAGQVRHRPTGRDASLPDPDEGIRRNRERRRRRLARVDQVADAEDDQIGFPHGRGATMGSFIPLCLAVISAASYPASAWRATPRPGSFVRTRSRRSAPSAVPSATVT